MRSPLRLLLTVACVASLVGDALGFFRWRSYVTPIATSASTNVTSESTSVTAESTIVTSESTSVTAESTNVTSESTRVTAESTSVTSESTSVTAKSTNVTSESTSVSADLTEDTSDITDDTEKSPKSSTVKTESSTTGGSNPQPKPTIDPLNTYMQEQEEIFLEMEKLVSQDSQWDAVYGRAIGHQMKNLQEEQLLFAQKIISDVIYNAKLGKLSEDSHVALNFSKEKNQQLITSPSLPNFTWPPLRSRKHWLHRHHCKH